MTTPTSVRKSIPYKQIYIDPARNARQDLPKVKEMGESLKVNGLINPLVVTNGGSPDPEKPYVLRGGFRRAAGWALNGWQNRDIDVSVREYKKGDAAAPVIDGIIDNKDREDVSPLDMAESLHQLVNGTYVVNEGEEAKPVDKKELAERLGMKPGSINNLLRVFDNLDPDVAKKARKAETPVRLMVQWAGFQGKGKTDDDKLESKATQQMEAFEEWFAGKEALEAEGRKKKPRQAAKKGSKGEGEGADDEGSMVNKVRTSYLSQCIEVLKLKLEEAPAAERATLTGRIEALRFVTGDLKKLPGVNKSDIEALEAADEEEVVVETEEEGEE